MSVDLWPGSSAKELLINGSYKAYVVADKTIGSYGDYSKWLTVDQGTSKTVVTVLIVNYDFNFNV